MNILKPLKALGYPLLPLVPECSYCAAMRFALVSAMLTGCIFGIGSTRSFWAYFLIGTFIGLIQVFFLWAEWHITHESKGEE
jgi:hypothetical protein